jgi:Ni/Co efflux regulator RcnB
MKTILKYTAAAAVLLACVGPPALAQNRDSNGRSDRGPQTSHRYEGARQHSNRNPGDYRRPLTRPGSNRSNRPNYGNRPGYVSRPNDGRYRNPYRPSPDHRLSYSHGYVRPGYVDHGPRYNWSRGDRLRAHYRGSIYVVNNYYDYDLRRPPHGYRWVCDDFGTYLLVAIATDIVADLIWSAAY